MGRADRTRFQSLVCFMAAVWVIMRARLRRHSLSWRFGFFYQGLSKTAPGRALHFGRQTQSHAWVVRQSSAVLIRMRLTSEHQ